MSNDEADDSPYEEDNYGGECWTPGEIDEKEAWYSPEHKGPLKKIYHKTADGDIHCCEECMGHTEYMGHCSCGYDICMRCKLPDKTGDAAAPASDSAPKGFLLCSACSSAKPIASYSSSQLKKKAKRKCVECSGASATNTSSASTTTTTATTTTTTTKAPATTTPASLPSKYAGEAQEHKTNAEKIFGCLACGQFYPASGYSASQLKKKGKRKCRGCSETTSLPATSAAPTSTHNNAPRSDAPVLRVQNLPVLQQQLDAWVTHFDQIDALTPLSEEWSEVRHTP